MIARDEVSEFIWMMAEKHLTEDGQQEIESMLLGGNAGVATFRLFSLLGEQLSAGETSSDEVITAIRRFDELSPQDA